MDKDCSPDCTYSHHGFHTVDCGRKPVTTTPTLLEAMATTGRLRDRYANAARHERETEQDALAEQNEAFADALTRVMSEVQRLRQVLQLLADNKLSEENCASPEVAGRRVAAIARAALLETP